MRSLAILLGGIGVVFLLGACATDDPDLGANTQTNLRANDPIPGVDKPGTTPKQGRTTPGWNF